MKIHPQIKTFSLRFVLLVLTIQMSTAQGPNAPEAASFEPVDATDMVNLATGDLSYVLPLLNVPGPEVGYPLSLSYHAGIAMDQEASWVGLGWSLNPGAINRSVNGYPDDWNNRKKTTILYDAGGTVTTHDISASIGWKNSNFSVGLFASYRVNKAFGGETSYDTSYGATLSIGRHSIRANNEGGIGYTYTIYKNTYASINYDKRNDFSFKLEVDGTGITLNSNGNHYLKVAGGSLQISGSGSLSPNLHTRTIGTVIYVDVNIGLFNFGYSRRKQRYSWYDRASYDCLGILYIGQTDEMILNSLNPTNASVDAYQSIYKTADNQQLLENNFTGPSYDSYTLSSQGLSGSITPYLFEHGTFKNRYNRVSSSAHNNTSYATQSTFSYYDNSFSKQVDDPNNDINFYFENINASYMSLSSGSWPTFSSVNLITDIDVDNEQTNHTTSINGTAHSNYNSANQRINNGPFIEVFTNGEIINNQNIIIEANEVNRSNKPLEGIGAYRVTNKDGLVYHYSLPVYQKEMFSRSTELEDNIDNKFYEEQQFTPYATHWLLTAITGPDYIKMSNDNISPNQGDYGYWVRFDYGKWSDGYAWRTPTKDLTYHKNDQSKSYGWGVKEIYYLDMIKTRTHTALFVKEDRNDNYGVEINIGASLTSPRVYNYGDKQVLGHSGSTYFVKGIYDNHAMNISTGVYFSNIWHKEYVNINKHKSLRLKEIFVLKNEDVPSNIKTYTSESNGKEIGEMYFEEEIRVYDTAYREVYHANYPLLNNGSLKEWKGEFYNNVLNSNDIANNFSNINDFKINHIEMHYDETYPSMRNSPNSLLAQKGKLTLSNVNFLGRGQESLIPPYEFSYLNDVSIYNSDNEDSWGFTADYPESSSLKYISTPLGSKFEITYEPDDFYQEAATNFRTYNDGIQFNFYNHEGKLRFDIENKTDSKDLNYFNDYFQVGAPVKVDIWAALLHEYRDPFCEDRSGSIDIQNEFVNVVYVSDTKVTFETSLSHTHNYNDGLNWLYSSGPMGLGFSDHTMQNLLRGQFPDLPDTCRDDTAVTFLFKIFAKDSKKNRKGGGLRVKDIAITDGTISYKTNYYYNDLNYSSDPNSSSYRSSGITSYAPSKFDKEIEYVTEMPPPGVTYGYVTTEKIGSDNTVSSKTVYNFETFKPIVKTDNSSYSLGLLYINKTPTESSGTYSVNGNNAKISSTKYVVKDNKSAIGRLLSVSNYNTSNQLLSKTNNVYRDFNENNQGVIQETFYSYTKNKIQGSVDQYLLNSSSKIINPNALLFSRKTSGGYTFTEVYGKYDFNTGQVLETITDDSKGNRFKTELIPAYTIPEYGSGDYSMGSKVDNPTNKNMLSQQAMSKTYMNVAGDWKETGVGITTWNNDWFYTDYSGGVSSPPNDGIGRKFKIWRKHKSFVWDGGLNDDGTLQGFTNSTPEHDDENFVWTVGPEIAQTNADWKNVSTTTQYDHYSMPLEVRDINGNYAATKMGDANSKVFMSANAKYGECFYTGAEDPLSGSFIGQQIKLVNGASRVSTYAHTGTQSIQIAPGNSIHVDFISGKYRSGNYKVSVWVKKDNAANVRVGFGSASEPFNGEQITAGDWVQLNHYMDLNGSSGYINITSNNGNIYADDLRVHPIASSMTSYVYNEWDELWYIIGTNGLASKFEYDAAGRLIKTYSEIIDTPSVPGGFKTVSKNYYNYGN